MTKTRIFRGPSSKRGKLWLLTQEKFCSLSPLDLTGRVTFATYKNGVFKEIALDQADKFGHASTGWYFIPEDKEDKPIRFFASQANNKVTDPQLGVLHFETSLNYLNYINNSGYVGLKRRE